MEHTLCRNEVELSGTVADCPTLSHENHGLRFYRFTLEVPRLSGQTDLLPILIPESDCSAVTQGSPLHLRGQFRSFNNKSGQGSRLILTVLAQELLPDDGTLCNRILLSGALCKPPTLRRTPLGRSICDLILAVPRKYGRADYLPVIAWGQLAAAASRRSVGSRLDLDGRIQSRIYHKLTEHGPEEHTAYEVSVMHLLDESPAEPAQAASGALV